MFDPSKHLMKLPGRKGNADYLEVKYRLVWFRDRAPHGVITTEAVLLDWEKGVAIYKATVEDGEGGKATGTGTEIRKSFEDFVEKAETRAIGRALAALGIGTQFVGEELSERGHMVDAPAPVIREASPKAEVRPAPPVKCPYINATRGQCTLDAYHDGEHVYGSSLIVENPPQAAASPSPSATAAASSASGDEAEKPAGKDEDLIPYDQIGELMKLAIQVGGDAPHRIETHTKMYPQGMARAVYDQGLARLKEELARRNLATNMVSQPVPPPEAPAAEAPKKRPVDLKSRGSVEAACAAMLKALAPGETAMAKGKRIALMKRAWGDKVLGWTDVTTLSLSHLKMGLATLQALEAQPESEKDVPDFATQEPPESTIAPEPFHPPSIEEELATTDTPTGDVLPSDDPEMVEGYVAFGDAETLRLWAESEGHGDAWDYISKTAHVAEEGHRLITADQYKRIRNAVRWRMEEERKAGV